MKTNLNTEWTKSSYSTQAGQGNCVEVRLHDGVPEVRDSKNPNAGELALSVSDFAGLVDVAKHGFAA